MSNNGLDHPLVREYLEELDGALRTRLEHRADELREQIRAHLDETLTAGADDGEVAATLRRLGSPADLAAEAGATTPDAATTARPTVTFASLARSRLARVRKRTWVLTVLTVVLIGVGAGYLTYYLSLANLQFAGVASWWFPQDYKHEVDTTADGASQSTVPLRSGQKQGFAVGIYNPTSFTQTVLGPAPDQGVPGSMSSKMGISVFNLDINHGGFIRQVRFTMPGSIPPHQTRLLRILWVSDVCQEAGGSSGIDQLIIRVRVGWFTRTETIPLDQGWYLSGPSHGPCA